MFDAILGGIGFLFGGGGCGYSGLGVCLLLKVEGEISDLPVLIAP